MAAGGESLHAGAVRVRDGVIADVGSPTEVRLRAPGVPVTDLGDVVLAPGLIDLHCHLEWSLVGGVHSGADGFGPWLGRLLGTPAPPGMFRPAADLGALRSLQAGTTTVIDNGPTGAGVAALTASGQRGIVHHEAFGSDPARAADAATRVAAAIAGAAADAGPRVAVGVSPHAPYSAGPALWHALAERLPAGTSWSTHIAESLDERASLRGDHGALGEALGRLGVAPAAWPGAGHGSSVRAMADAGVLTPGLIAAHLVHVDDADIALLAAHGVRAAHCPISNATLRCGRSPVEALRAAGLPVALGTDSPSSAGTYDLRAEARACLAAHAGAGLHFSPRQLLAMATSDAAAALGREGDLGAIAPGHRADIIAVRPRAEAFPGDPCAAVLDAGSAVESAWVDGECLLRDGLPTRLDAVAVEARAAEMRRLFC